MHLFLFQGMAKEDAEKGYVKKVEELKATYGMK